MISECAFQGVLRIACIVVWNRRRNTKPFLWHGPQAQKGPRERSDLTYLPFESSFSIIN